MSSLFSYPTGSIRPEDRTPEQQDAHAKAVSKRVSFGLLFKEIPVGTKIILTDFWKDPEVIADVGFEFTRFHQLTGSCVGASTGNAIFTLAAVQRNLSEGATKAFLPWWPYDYGRCRYKEGDRGQGEGAVDSVMGEVLKEGVLPYDPATMPAFKTDDGFYLTEKIELQWSDGAKIPSNLIETAKKFPVGAVATAEDPQTIATGIVNGFPCLNGCSMFIQAGKIKGSGKDAYVVGRYDGRGGHSTCFLGVWHHPNDGLLFLYSNQWPGQTYPKDPAGGGPCCVWTPESEVLKGFRNYGMGNGECMLLSHLNYFPAQPELMEWKKYV
jgi:hypothetical protein